MKKPLAIGMLLSLLCSANVSRVVAQAKAPVGSGHKYLRPPSASLARMPVALSRLPLLFEKNMGQLDSSVRFLARGPGYSLLLQGGEAVLALQPPPVPVGPPARAGVLSLKLVGSDPRSKMGLQKPLPTKVNYFLERGKAKSITHIPTGAQVLESGVYPGIDQVYYGSQRKLEYDLRVAPRADPNRIVMRFGGARRIEINGRGELVFGVGSGTVIQHAPIVCQRIGAAS